METIIDREHGFFETSDLYLASCLRTEGVALEKIEKGPDGRAIFVFNPNGYDVIQLREQYFLGSLCQPVRVYVQNWKALRKAIEQVL
jgi:hypothetical protein